MGWSTRRGQRAVPLVGVTAIVALVLHVPTLDAAAFAADPTVFVGPAPASDAAGRVRYRVPAPGQVVRPFQPPKVAFGSGHRGVDLGIPVGTSVAAAGDGVVSHAGPIAGTTWVAIAHPDGVVTSYGPLADRRVSRGDEVRGGQSIGVLAAGGHGDGDGDDGLHWGARRDGVYIDPMGLVDGGTPRPSLIGSAGWEGSDHAVDPYQPWPGARLRGWTYAPSPAADRPGFAVAPNANHLVMLSGLGSSSESVPIDPAHLGYDPRSVTLFSYAGRADLDGDPGDPRRDQRPFDATDTVTGVDAAARRLSEQLKAQARREPGRAVDLVGHSMGGVVIVHYLAHYHDAYDAQLPPVGNVVTIASPLQGSDLATLVTDVGSHTIAGPLLGSLADVLARGWSGGALVPIDAPAIGDLATGSGLLRGLATAWDRAQHTGPAGPLAMGTRVLTIGAGSDQLVAASRSSLPQGSGLPWDGRGVDAGDPVMLDGDALRALGIPVSRHPGPDAPVVEHRILPGGHHGVLTSEAVREVVWRFLAGQEVVASPGRLAHLISEENGITLRLTGQLVRLHDLAWQPLRRAALPPPTVARPRTAPPATTSHLPSARGTG